ncbi:MAG: hypothetical protein ACPIOQ_59115 [Promethearchaeia archaeon]
MSGLVRERNGGARWSRSIPGEWPPPSAQRSAMRERLSYNSILNLNESGEQRLDSNLEDESSKATGRVQKYVPFQLN